MTDGGVYKRKNLVYFDSISPVLTDLFKQICKRLGIQKFTEQMRKTKCIQCYSKEFVELLLSFSPTYRTKPCNEYPICTDNTCKHFRKGKYLLTQAKFPDFIVKAKPPILYEYLRILFSTEGCASMSVTSSGGKFRISRYVLLTAKHPVIRNQITLMLRRAGLKPKTFEYDIVIKGEEKIRTFHKKIGFLPGVKATLKSKRWSGFEKNEILRKILKSYKLAKQDRNLWNAFENREKIYDFLIKL